jgi:hypothetical protein
MFFHLKFKVNLFLLTLFLFFFSVCAITDLSASSAVVIDASGSMRGFYITGSIHDFIDEIAQRSRIEDAGLLYFHEKELVSYKKNIDLRWLGNSTWLDIAFSNAKEKGFKSILLITDNLQSTGDDTDDARSFYRSLASEDVEKVYIVPKFLDFNGFIDMPDGNKVRYRGERGILCYLIKLRDEMGGTETDSQFNNMLNVFTKEELLLVKPITQNEISIVGVKKEEEESVNAALIRSVSECNFDVEGIKRPNVAIERNGKITVYDPKFAPVFHFDKKNSLQYFFNLKSELNHINIGKDDNPCDDGIAMSVSDLLLSPLSRNGERFFRRRPDGSAGMTGQIIPPHFVGRMDSGQTSKTYYYVEVQFGPYKIPIGINNFHRYISWSPVPVGISMNIKLSVPPDYFSLTPDYRNRFFTDDVNEFRRIFSPVDIVAFINQESVDIYLNVSSHGK